MADQNVGNVAPPVPVPVLVNIVDGVPRDTTPLLPGASRPVRVEARPLSSVKKTFSNIVISIVGAGVLGMPYTFKESGWLCGSLALAFVGFSCYYNMMLLVASKKRLESFPDGHVNDGVESYSELGYVTFGAAGEFGVDFAIVLSQGGFCTAYLIFIGENLASLFGGTHHGASPPDPYAGEGGMSLHGKAMYIWLLFPLQAWLASIRSLAQLAPFSICADLANFAAMAVVMKEDVVQVSREGIQPANQFTGWTSIPFVLGVAIYAFEGFGLVLPIESNMEDRSKFGRTLATALAVITVVFITFALLGYIAFGDLTKDIITLNLGRTWQTAIIKAALCMGLFFTFPVMMLPVHELVEKKLRDGSPSVLLRTMTITLISLTAVAVPHFGSFLSLIGSSVCCMLSFVFPAMFHLKTHRGNLRQWQIFTDYASLTFGVLFGTWGTWTALTNFL